MTPQAPMVSFPLYLYSELTHAWLNLTHPTPRLHSELQLSRRQWKKSRNSEPSAKSQMHSTCGMVQRQPQFMTSQSIRLYWFGERSLQAMVIGLALMDYSALQTKAAL